jgi:hypothetical protein
MPSRHTYTHLAISLQAGLVLAVAKVVLDLLVLGLDLFGAKNIIDLSLFTNSNPKPSNNRHTH